MRSGATWAFGGGGCAPAPVAPVASVAAIVAVVVAVAVGVGCLFFAFWHCPKRTERNTHVKRSCPAQKNTSRSSPKAKLQPQQPGHRSFNYYTHQAEASAGGAAVGETGAASTPPQQLPWGSG
ncbi:unnamed protein product [Ectocarpus sp. 13 AM-2016]